MNRKEIIIELVDQRYTYQRIGDIFGISRQRIHQIYRNYHSAGLGGVHLLREKKRKEDKYTCQLCGKVWKEGKRRLDVHHLDEELEGKEGLKYKNCKDFSRIITLCHRCHLNLESVRNKMKINWGKNTKRP